MELGRLLHFHRPAVGATMPAHILVLPDNEDGLPIGERQHDQGRALGRRGGDGGDAPHRRRQGREQRPQEEENVIATYRHTCIHTYMHTYIYDYSPVFTALVFHIS